MWRIPRSKEELSALKKRHPDTAMNAARIKEACFEKAVEALGDYDGPELPGLKHALSQARASAQELPVDVQISECREFIKRGHRHRKMDVVVGTKRHQFIKCGVRKLRRERDGVCNGLKYVSEHRNTGRANEDTQGQIHVRAPCATRGR